MKWYLKNLFGSFLYCFVQLFTFISFVLQALAALCRIHEEDSLPRLSGNFAVDNTGIRAEDVNMKSSLLEMETHLFSASRNAFKEFPRGADLLSYLFDKLSVSCLNGQIYYSQVALYERPKFFS